MARKCAHGTHPWPLRRGFTWFSGFPFDSCLYRSGKHFYFSGKQQLCHEKQLLRKRILEISEEYHLGVDPDQEVWKLDLGQRQHIEIIKVLINAGTRVMIFDEPTSVLAPHEISSFLDMLISFKTKDTRSFSSPISSTKS